LPSDNWPDSDKHSCFNMSTCSVVRARTVMLKTIKLENSIVLRDVPQIATQYEKEFNRLWAESEVLAPAY